MNILSKRRSSSSAISPVMNMSGDSLAPLWEGPTPDALQQGCNVSATNTIINCTTNNSNSSSSSWESVRQWMKERLVVRKRCSDPKLLLGVMGCPLAPIPASNDHLQLCHLSALVKEMPIDFSCAQYIVQQYLAACGGFKVIRGLKNSYTRGKVRMLTTEFETPTQITKNPIKAAENGWFVLWQMLPDKWHVELEIEGNTAQAGCNGTVVWRSTSWLDAHAAKGPIRPLRRVIQGLDPITTANMFVNAKCVGEKKIGMEDCFVLQVCADPDTLSLRKDGSADVIRHNLSGYFSQRTGLLVFVEDSHLTRIQNSNAEVVYWETTMESVIEDYRVVDGVSIAHAGRTAVTVFRFGEESMSHTRTRMEEMWVIEETAFNVEGLSMDSFLPPSQVREARSKKV